jgi:hypothetical protein
MFIGNNFYFINSNNYHHPFIAPPPKAEWYHKRMKEKLQGMNTCMQVLPQGKIN